jgi:tRNA-2-methylthio-N6-dimethylallyladenosine synthase
LGQNVNSYNSENLSFPQLLEKIAAIPGLKRLRFATSHPKDLSDELIAVMAKTPVLCKNLHLPFQAGSNVVLERMNRGYTIEKYLSNIQKVKNAMPEIALTTDVIVGFPGETDEDFQRTLDIIKEVGFDNSFTFIYSERGGTKAAEVFPDDVTKEQKAQRMDKLLVLQKEVGLEQLKKDVGKVLEILVESVSKKRDDEWKGRTEQNRIVIFKANREYQPGEYINVKITAAEGLSLFGEVVG